MVVTMDALEKAELAERRPSPTDRRARIIAVTEAGARDGGRGRRDRRRGSTSACSSASADEREAFIGALQRLVERPAGQPAGVLVDRATPEADRSELDRLERDNLLRFGHDRTLLRDSRWFALVVLCVGMLMIVLDPTIVNVALPVIQA